MSNLFYTTLDLQLFADAGTVTNTLGGSVNSYTGETSATTAMSGELKTFYDTELLENARVEMFYAQFAKKQRLPKNHGKTVEWRKWNTFAKASKIEEGVIPTGQKFGMSSKTGSISQYGTYATVSDTLELRAYDDVILGATEEMGASAAETQETLIRDALATGTNVLYCPGSDVDSDTGELVGITTPSKLEEMEWYNHYLTPDVIAKAVTIMKNNRVPTINGKYYMVIHPNVAYHLRSTDAWIEAHKYGSPGEIFNGEIGELHGCRFIENVFAPTVTYNDTRIAYYNYMFGKDAFGIIDPEGGALEMIVKDKSEVGGPLNQFSTIGYKLETNGATILYPERLLRIVSQADI